jgi:bifunctional ADP-heptose synthase (sugar kinase/adenylyltransferase)
MKQPTIAVFGDMFIDNYYIGSTTRISPEAPIPVVKVTEKQWFNGGAGNVVANLRALGATGMHPNTLYPEPCPTKNRLICHDQQVARWDENDECRELDVKAVRNTKADAVIISDYGKGSITYAIIEAIAALNLPTFIDTKRSPRDFDVVWNPTFFPNQKEYEQYYMDYKLQPSVVYKRGADGIEFHQFGSVIGKYPAFADKVVSVCGAGDSVLSAFVYASLTHHSDPLLFASLAAAVVVGKPYTAIATLDEIESMRCKYAVCKGTGYVTTGRT